MAIDYVLEHNPNGYIAFLDADDFWDSRFFNESVVALMTQGYSLIGFQSCNCTEDHKKRNSPTPLKCGDYVGGTNAVWIHSTQSFGAMLYSAKLLKDYHIRFPLIPYNEDKIFIMQCLYLADTIRLENKLLYYYVHRSTSAVHSRRFGMQYFPP